MDALAQAVDSAFDAVSASLPSQFMLLAVSGERMDGAASRPLSGVVRAILASNSFADPIGEFSTSTEARSLSFLVKRNGEGAWFDFTDPRESDVFTTEHGVSYSAVSVSDVRGLYYKITARQC